MITTAILGLGGRGGMFGRRISKMHDMQVVAIADIRKSVVDKKSEDWNVAPDKRFYSDEEFFAAGKLADAVLICTQDKEHYRHTMAALRLGYHVFLEKPVSPVLSECEEIEAYAREHGLKILVGYVLRYSSFFMKIKELIASGIIGEVVQIRHNENVSYSHFVRSYVRGAWKSEANSSPFIMAKCSHDMDLLYWWAGSPAKYVSSFGELRYFKKENMPKGATKSCFDCPLAKTCLFEAYKTTYRDRYFVDMFFKGRLRPKKVRNARIAEMKRTGRDCCAFDAGNDVVDFQCVTIAMKNGVNCIFTTGAFHNKGFRDTIIMGTKGEIHATEIGFRISVTPFGGKTKRFRMGTPLLGGHAGGDGKILYAFRSLLLGELDPKNCSSVGEAIESQRICFAAEESRKQKKTIAL